MKKEDNLKKIQAIMMDVDGVLTDAKIILGSNNIELKAFNVRDGLAITIASKCGLKIGFITGRTSDVVGVRGEDLKVDYIYQGVTDKLSKLKEIASDEEIPLENICYIGDDLVDIKLLNAVGFSATVADAPEEVRSCVSFISSKKGGDGAVREIIEYILKAQGKWQQSVDQYQ